MSQPRRSRQHSRFPLVVRLVLALGLAGGLLGVGLVATNAFSMGDRFERLVARVDRVFNPVPDRTIPPLVVVTASPSADPTPGPTPPPAASGDPTASADPTAPPPTPTPTPARVRVDVDILADNGIDPTTMFASQVTNDWCAVAGTQMVLAIHGVMDTSEQAQRELAGRIREWESVRDSLNGGWGPAAMVAALEAHGVRGYEVRAYDDRQSALRDSAAAIARTGAPTILLTWRGAHTWVMTGYKANSDPAAFPDAYVNGAYILDPWYPRVSSIWGPSDGPGVYQDTDEMKRNYLPWKRPEGTYPDRDGRYIAVVPTLSLADAVVAGG